MSLVKLHFFQITNILEKHPVWREYKDQKHDLFISDRPVAGYLTGKQHTNVSQVFSGCLFTHMCDPFDYE